MSLNNSSVLVVEDDSQIQSFIAYALENEGFTALKAKKGQEAMSILLTRKIDIMLLDLGLPDCDGMDIILKVRELSELPIIVVSARDQDKEKVAALDAGADDYLTKPFSAMELLARVRVAVRHRLRQNESALKTELCVGALKMDLARHQVYLNSGEIHLTPMEYKLLELLFKNIGKVLTTANILSELWGVGYGNDTQALRTVMAGLRRKIEEKPAKPRYIITEVGVGYRLTDE